MDHFIDEERKCYSITISINLGVVVLEKYNEVSVLQILDSSIISS